MLTELNNSSAEELKLNKVLIVEHFHGLEIRSSDWSLFCEIVDYITESINKPDFKLLITRKGRLYYSNVHYMTIESTDDDTLLEGALSIAEKFNLETEFI